MNAIPPQPGPAAEQHAAGRHRPRGIYLSIDRPDDIETSFAALGLGPGDVDIIACSGGAELPGTGLPGTGLPGTGERGAGGVRRAAGKLAVYTACGGIRPDRGIAVSLDIRSGGEYEAFISSYVRTAAKLFPGALLHFQDFGAGQARWMLQAFGRDYRVYDDTVQGTGAVVLAAVYAASRVTGIPVKHQTVVVAGTGDAGLALADQVRAAISADGAADEQARNQIWLADPGGLADAAGLAHVIGRTAPTILLGTAAARQAFSRPVITAMCQATSRPLIVPVCGPGAGTGAGTGATPSDIIAWSHGRALVATAVPADPVEYAGTRYAIGQLNSALVFPGLGLGVVVSGAAAVTPHMLQAAAAAVAEQADASRPGAPLLPGPQDLRALSAQVAEAVVRAAVADKVATVNPTSLTRAVRDAMWKPGRPGIG